MKVRFKFLRDELSMMYVFLTVTIFFINQPVPILSGHLNYDINETSDKHLHFSVQSLNFDYGDSDGLYRPVNSRKEKLCFYDNHGTSDYWANMGLGIIPDINVYGKDQTGHYLRPFRVYGSTSHELAHASHCTWLGQIEFWQVDQIIYESWAEFVEWVLTKKEYYQYAGFCPITDTYQEWPIDVKEEYLQFSPIFFDCVDTINQSLTTEGTPFDEVSGYSNSTLNSILLSSQNLSDLKENLKLWKPNNVTDQQIDSLFVVYEETMQ